MLKKLQRKFVILTTSVSVIVMLIIGVSINLSNYFFVIHQADLLIDVLMSNDFKMLEDFSDKDDFSRERAFTTRFFVVLSNSIDTIEFVDTKNVSTVSPEEAIDYVEQVKEIDKKTGTIDNYRFFRLDSSYGHAYIFLDIEEQLMGFENTMFYSIMIFITAIVLIAIISWFFSGKAVAPIAESYERQKRFITDVSHEFKTPLTIIKTNSDVLEIDGYEGDSTKSINTQVERLNTLVESLISLTKLDEPAEVIKTDFSISEILSETIAEFKTTAKKKNINLVEFVSKNISYTGEQKSIRELFIILLDNAIKYAPEQTEINLSLANKGTRKVFTIENRCENIDIGKHNFWFERFYREDKARNGESKGYGIGLSIAKSICDIHGAKIFAESKTENSVTITVIF